jgi:hypothetical protein
MAKRTITKDVRRVFHVEDARISGKAEGGGSDAGFVEGYAATWDNVDLGDEVMRRGAFAKSIRERVPAGHVALMVKHFAHGGDVLDCVGQVTSAKEDDVGLFFHADFIPDDELAANVRNKVVRKIVKACSVGYGPITWGFTEIDGREVIEHTESKLYEVTLTLVPMNEQALLTAAKSLGVPAEDLDAVAAVMSIGAGTLEDSRSQIDVVGRDKVETAASVFRAVAKKLDDLMSIPPGADSVAGHIDSGAMRRQIEGMRQRLVMLDL